jgi:hypothetical protein
MTRAATKKADMTDVVKSIQRLEEATTLEIRAMAETQTESNRGLERAILNAADNSVVCVSLQNIREITHAIEMAGGGTSTAILEDRIDMLATVLAKAIEDSGARQVEATRENTKALILLARAMAERK